MKILQRKKLLELKEQEHPLFIEKRDKYFKENPNSYLKYGDYIAEITYEELQDYGIKKWFDMNKQETKCKECGGTGELECQGDSHYIDTLSSHDCFNPTCEECEGRGFIGGQHSNGDYEDEDCPSCNRTGKNNIHNTNEDLNEKIHEGLDKLYGEQTMEESILKILQKQQYITNQGINYNGKKDVALNEILSLISIAIQNRDKEIVEMLSKRLETINDNYIEASRDEFIDKKSMFARENAIINTIIKAINQKEL